MVKLPEEQWDLIPQSAIIYVLFPNTVLVVQGDHVETWHVYPHASDPGACTTYFSLYTPNRRSPTSSAGTGSAISIWRSIRSRRKTS